MYINGHTLYRSVYVFLSVCVCLCACTLYVKYCTIQNIYIIRVCNVWVYYLAVNVSQCFRTSHQYCVVFLTSSSFYLILFLWFFVCSYSSWPSSSAYTWQCTIGYIQSILYRHIQSYKSINVLHT